MTQTDKIDRIDKKQTVQVQQASSQGESGQAEQKIRISLLGNAGLLIEYRGAKLLLDAVYGTEPQPFSNIPPDVMQKLMTGQPPFEHIDCLLFTHLHPDHFSPKLLRTLLETGRVGGVILPDSEKAAGTQPMVQADYAALVQKLREGKTPCMLLTEQTDRAVCRISPHITVRGFHTGHLDRKYRAVEHVCYRIAFDQRNILFTADADYLNATFEDFTESTGTSGLCWERPESEIGEKTEVRPEENQKEKAKERSEEENSEEEKLKTRSENEPEGIVGDHTGNVLEAVFVNPLFFNALQRPGFLKFRFRTKQLCIYHVPFAPDDSMHMRAGIKQGLSAFSAQPGAVPVHVLSEPYAQLLL